MKKKGNVIGKFLILIIISIAVGFTFKPLLNSLNFGLDLQGGFEVLYQVKSIDGKKVSKDMVTSTYKTIGKRIDVLGVSEPNITVEGEDKIRVQLAGVTNQEQARETLSKAASLTFRDTNDNLLMTADVLKSGGAKVGEDSEGRPAVALSVKDKDKFFKMTKKVSEMQDKRLVIWLDYEETDSFANEQNRCGSLSASKCLSAATVSQGFASDVIIQGDFTLEQVTNLVELINSGSLPTKLEEISSKTVEASFGENSLEKTFLAGIVGIVLIMLFMIIIYRFAGIISSIGILFYTLITFLIFWVIGGVLTLPGIAALVIGIGMAVDASVLNFSRIKDELYEGNNLQTAFKNGNKNSFWTIFDSNLTTLLVAIILFIFGESSIKGFATMLIISICVTMLIMVFLSRTLLKIFVKTKFFDDKLKFFIGINPKKITKDKEERIKSMPFSKIDFVRGRKWYFLVSIIIIILGTAFIGIKGLKLGIDFKGGSSITLTTNQKLDEKTLTNDIKELKLKLDHIETLNDDSTMIKITDTLDKDKVAQTEKYFKEKYKAKTEIGVVSNVVKQELVKNAVISVLLAMIGIILYMAFRFTFHYAISGILAILIDVFVIISLFSILRLEVSSIFIAAILSIIGYAINDTIVTFDRIKENIKKKGKKNIKNEEQLKEIVNLSLRQTFMRSIITTITTLIPVVSLIVLGSHEIFNFNLALLFGLVYGIFSSVFIASGLWYQLEKKEIGKPEKKKWYEE